MSCAQTCRSIHTPGPSQETPRAGVHQTRPIASLTVTHRSPREMDSKRPLLVRPTTPCDSRSNGEAGLLPETPLRASDLFPNRKQPGTTAATLGQLWRGLSWNWHHLELMGTQSANPTSPRGARRSWACAASLFVHQRWRPWACGDLPGGLPDTAPPRLSTPGPPPRAPPSPPPDLSSDSPNTTSPRPTPTTDRVTLTASPLHEPRRTLTPEVTRDPPVPAGRCGRRHSRGRGAACPSMAPSTLQKAVEAASLPPPSRVPSADPWSCCLSFGCSELQGRWRPEEGSWGEGQVLSWKPRLGDVSRCKGGGCHHSSLLLRFVLKVLLAS